METLRQDELDFAELINNYVESSDPEYREAVAYLINSGGKRIRPRLCMEFAGALSSHSDKVQLESFCLGLELVHNASLVHDDLPALDNSDERRGKPAIHIQYGVDRALLLGDYLIANPIELLCRDQRLEPKLKLAQIELLVKGVSALCVGQAEELSLEERLGLVNRDNVNRDKSWEMYCNVYRNKTGALFGVALAGAGTLSFYKQAQFSENLILKELYNLGVEIGVLFQIYDDQEDFTNRQDLGIKNPYNFLGQAEMLSIAEHQQSKVLELEEKIKKILTINFSPFDWLKKILLIEG